MHSHDNSVELNDYLVDCVIMGYSGCSYLFRHLKIQRSLHVTYRLCPSEIRQRVFPGFRASCQKHIEEIIVLLINVTKFRVIIPCMLFMLYTVFPPNIAPPLIIAPPLFGTEKYIITYSNSTLFFLKTTFFDRCNTQHECK